MSQVWFVVREDGEEGPLNPQQLKKLVAEGKLRPGALVRRADMASARPAREVKGLFLDAHPTTRETADSVGRTADTVKRVARNVGKVADAVSEVADATEKVRKAASSVAGLVGTLSTFLGSVGDFLRPLANVNLIVCLLAGAATPVLALIARRQTRRQVAFAYGIAAVATLVIAIVFGMWTGLAVVAGRDDRGVLATNVPSIERLQEQVLPVKAPAPPPARLRFRLLHHRLQHRRFRSTPSRDTPTR